MQRQALIIKVFWGASRSRRDCGNLEAVMNQVNAGCDDIAAVAATAGILRRLVAEREAGLFVGAAVAATAGILRRSFLRVRIASTFGSRSRRDCGNLEAGGNGVCLSAGLSPQSPRRGSNPNVVLSDKNNNHWHK